MEVDGDKYIPFQRVVRLSVGRDTILMVLMDCAFFLFFCDPPERVARVSERLSETRTFCHYYPAETDTVVTCLSLLSPLVLTPGVIMYMSNTYANSSPPVVCQLPRACGPIPKRSPTGAGGAIYGSTTGIFGPQTISSTD